MAARLKRFDSAPPGKKVVKISTDVYPDPEPDVGITAAAIAAVIQEKKPVVPTKVFMDKEGRLVDEEGNVIPEEGKAPSRKRKAEAIEEEETVLDSALVKRQRKGRKGALQLLDHPEEDAERHTKQADKLRSIEESRKEYIEKRKLADAAMEAGEKLMIDQEGADMLKATPAIVPVNTTTMEVLEAEWWDAAITVNKTYGDITAAPSPLSWNLKHKMISSLIEHPVPSNGQHVEKHLAPQALILTQKERLKVRKQSRIAREKEKQKQIALGLLPTPPPKVKISNMARVFQHKFIADPTACEQFAREEMMKRVGNHEDRNQARKLSKDQKREKTINKLKREAETDPITTVYRIDKLHSSKAEFQIIKNAQQYYLSGFLVVTDTGAQLVIVEGGRKPLRKYDRLLRQRIDYMLEGTRSAADNATVVWSGVSGKRYPGEFKKVSFHDEEKAHQYLNSMECGHYWEMMLEGREQAMEIANDADDNEAEPEA